MTYSVTTEGAWAVTRQNTDMGHTIKRVTADCVEARDIGDRLLDEVSTRAAVIAAERKMKKRGFTTTRKQEGRKIRLVVHS